MQQSFFIAGTDTDIGKTYITYLLVKFFAQQGKTVAGIKPLSAGANQNNSGQWQNDDALLLQKISNVNLSYQQVNPICLIEPCSPHLAAQKQQVTITIDSIPTSNINTDILLYEGAGGWFTPINQQQTLADWVIKHQLSVILVVGIKLGCLNHAQLTWQAMESANINCVGWIANCCDPNMVYIDENINYLTNILPMPLLAKATFKATELIWFNEDQIS